MLKERKIVFPIIAKNKKFRMRYTRIEKYRIVTALKKILKESK